MKVDHPIKDYHCYKCNGLITNQPEIRCICSQELGIELIVFISTCFNEIKEKHNDYQCKHKNYFNMKSTHPEFEKYATMIEEEKLRLL